MSEFLAENWLLSIVLTIFLGAIGSGLWDAILKPYGKKFSGVVFTAITFGAKRARDKVYKNASAGHHELPSLYLLLIVFMFLCGILVSLQVKVYSRIYVSTLAETYYGDCINKNEKERKECGKKIIEEEILPIMYILSLITVFLSVVILYRFSTINRTNLVITYYTHSMSVIRPYIEEQQYLLFEQKFALMLSKEDYDEIIKSLNKIANDNSVDLPEYIER